MLLCRKGKYSACPNFHILILNYQLELCLKYAFSKTLTEYAPLLLEPYMIHVLIHLNQLLQC